MDSKVCVRPEYRGAVRPRGHKRGCFCCDIIIYNYYNI